MRASLILRRSRRTRGFVMVSVMWMGLGLLLAVTGFVSQSRLGALSIRAEVETLRAQELARSGLNLALAELTRRVTSDTSATTLNYALAEGRVAVTITDEAGKIDINEAPVEILRPLLQGVVQGADAFDATNMAQTIVSTRRDSGPYRALDTLFAQFGISGSTASALRRVMTVHNYTSRVDPQSAPALVLAAIPGLGPSDAEEIIRLRGQGAALPRFGTAAVWLAPRTGPVYHLTSQVKMTGGITAEVTALVRSNGLAFGSDRLRFEVMEWRTGS